MKMAAHGSDEGAAGAWRRFVPGSADVLASMGVFFVAIPLSLGIAVASGASPVAGIIAAICGGILTGILAGAPLMVSGPAAGLVALVIAVVDSTGLRGLAIATMFAGALQLALAALRAGALFRLVPAAVLKGMLAGIGFVILLSQLNPFLGAQAVRGVGPSLAALPSAVAGVASSLGALHAFLAGGLALVLLVAWGKAAPKLHPSLARVPAALPAVVLATLVAVFVLSEAPRVEMAPLGAAVAESFTALFGALPPRAELEAALAWGLALALVASAETLLTARAIETLSPGPKPRLDRELLAQGAGNLVSGALGGLPITGVIVRSAANVQFGAKTRWSAILHGVWVLIFAVAATQLLTMIPLAALAAVLIVTGVKLLDPRVVLQFWRTRPADALVWGTTFATIVATDLLKGLAAGLLVAVLVDRRRLGTWFVARLARSRRDQPAQ